MILLANFMLNQHNATEGPCSERFDAIEVIQTCSILQHVTARYRYITIYNLTRRHSFAYLSYYYTCLCKSAYCVNHQLARFPWKLTIQHRESR